MKSLLLAVLLGGAAFGQQAITISSTSPLTAANLGVLYSNQITYTSIQPYQTTWSVSAGSLPPGLVLGSQGLISGLPSTVGTYNFSIRVAANGTIFSDTKAFTLVVNASTVALATTSFANGNVGVAYSQPINVTTSPTGLSIGYTVSAGTLPPGLSLDPNGAIFGTPTTPGTYNFSITVQLQVAGVTDTKAYSITILNPPFSISNQIGRAHV